MKQFDISLSSTLEQAFQTQSHFVDDLEVEQDVDFIMATEEL